MKNRVRYICVPVTSFELADALTEHEKSVFIEQVLRMFTTCEAGDDPVPEQTENRVLDIALEGAAREIKKGFDSYVQKQTAREEAERRKNGDKSPTDQRSTGDQPANGREKDGKDGDLGDLGDVSESSEMPALTEFELRSIDSALSYAGIEPDSSFYTFAKRVGYRVTIDSIRQARDEKSRSLPYVIKLMKQRKGDN